MRIIGNLPITTGKLLEIQVKK